MHLKKYLPIADWLPQYKRGYLSGDLTAGLTVGIMLIPQGMAYAMLAGLPPVYGLYASMMPQVVYAIFGTSRQLAVGPVAMDSLLMAAGVSVFAVAGSEHYIALALLLSFMMGAIQLSFGLLRMGFLVNFLSKPVISGFTSAAALIIGMSQLKHLLGINLGNADSILNILYYAFLKFSEISWLTVALGIGGILAIKYIKKLHPAIPGPLAAVLMSIPLAYLLRLDLQGVKVLGTVPQGLPSFAVPTFDRLYIEELIPTALALSLIAFMEAISVAKALHAHHKGEYALDANQELIGLGLGNMLGSFVGCYPTTGGFSRSAVNEQSGAKTNMAAIISASLIVLTLLFLTPFFYYLPNAILASVIMVAVFGLIDWTYPQYLWKVQREDFFMLLLAFMVTLFVGIQQGIGVGVVISLIVMVYRTTRPHVAILGRLPKSKEYRNVTRFADIEVRPDVLVLRYDAQLYFANTSHFMETMREAVAEKGGALKLVVLYCGSISYIDSTALQALQELHADLTKANISFYLAGLIGPVRDFLHKTGFIEQVGDCKFHLNIQAAIDAFDRRGEEQPSQYALQTGLIT